MLYVAATGNVLIMVGLLVQVLLAPVCGSNEAYENCFRDCPLSTDPLTFNHNAIFHTLVAIGITVQAIGWWWWPIMDNDNDPDKDEKNACDELSDSSSDNV